MNLTLARFEFTGNSTLGALYQESRYLCYVLEDAVRKEKVYGRTAIPSGRYQVEITWSDRFDKPLPLLADVPLFTGIRIHPGNTSLHTDGCLLPGYGKGRLGDELSVTRSKDAMDNLILPIFKNPKESVYLTILGGYPAEEMTGETK